MNKRQMQLLASDAPTWVVEKRFPRSVDKLLIFEIENYIATKELDDEIIGPVIHSENQRNIIKVKCSKRAARILSKVPGVIRLTETTSEINGENYSAFN